MIVPGWKSAGWWQDLQEMVVAEMPLKKRKGLFMREGKDPMPPPRWQVWAFLVDGTKQMEPWRGSAEEAGVCAWPLHTVPGVEWKQVDGGCLLTEEEVERIAAQV